MKSTKKNTADKVDPKTPAVEPAKAPARTPMDIPAANLRHAPWNTRTKITPESVADLTASISKDGLIQRIVVVRDTADDSVYTVIAGNRRLVACREAGLDPVPCELLDVASAAQARRLTLLENLQRQDADPLQESSLIEALVNDGMSLAEIAAETGRGEKWVVRRKNLVNLCDAWRKRAAAGKISTDCLEHVAAYPKEIQEKLVREDKWRDSRPGGLHWYDISHCFTSVGRELKEAFFDTTPCRSCANNSGVTPDLFDWDDKPAALGRCLCSKCYKQKWTAAVDAAIKEAKDAGWPVVNGRPDYDVRTSLKRTPKCTVFHKYKNYSGESVAVWAEPSKRKSADAGKSEEERAKELKAAQAELAKKKARNKAIRKLAELCAKDDALATALQTRFFAREAYKDTVSIVSFVPFVISFAFYGFDNYHLPCCRSSKTDAATAAIFGNLDIPKHWPKVVAKEIIRKLDPSKSDGFYAVRNSKVVLAMFPAFREQLGEDDAKLILSRKSVDAFCAPKIAWDKDPDEK